MGNQSNLNCMAIYVILSMLSDPSLKCLATIMYAVSLAI